MLKKTLYLNSPLYLNTQNELICITNKETGLIDKMPIDDVAYIIVENQQITLTLGLLQKLAESNVSLIVCDKQHMPTAAMYNFSAHTTQTQTISNQIEVKENKKNQIWKQIIQSKIDNQACLLEKLGKDGKYLRNLSKKVSSGDAKNCEGIAARHYWQSLFEFDFKREPEGEYPNNFLNYGYSLIRAGIARAIAGSGLLPMLGVHHSNKYNYYPLADDLMEPYRPFVDEIVYSLTKDDSQFELNKTNKAELMKVLTADVYFSQLKRPLSIGLTFTSASYAKLVMGKSNKLVLPTLK